MAALLLFGVIALVILLAFLPAIKWQFHIDVSLMLGLLESRVEANAPVSAREAYREVSLQLEGFYDANAPKLVGLVWVLRAAFALLILAVVASVVEMRL